MTYKIDKTWLEEEALEIDILGAASTERTCERCGETSRRVISCPSYTHYHWEGEGEDPNADHLLCIECADAYTDQMEEQWANYYSGLL